MLPIWNVEAPILGRPGEIYGVADHPTYRDNWPLLEALPDAWDLVAQGEGVMVNEQLYRREGLRPWRAARPARRRDDHRRGLFRLWQPAARKC